jgi:hypothetical protein
VSNSTVDQVDTDWSTVVGNQVTTPQAVSFRGYFVTPQYLTDAAGTIYGTVVQEPTPATSGEQNLLQCPNLVSGGYNQISDYPGYQADCHQPVENPTDLSSQNPIVSTDRTYSGPALVPFSAGSPSPGADWQMVTQAPLISPLNGVGPQASAGGCPYMFDVDLWTLGIAGASSPLVSPFWPVDYDEAGNTRTSFCSPGAAQYPFSSPTLTTTPSPTAVTLDTPAAPLEDTATLSGGDAPTGTIVFTLYNSEEDPIDIEHVTVSGNGTYSTPTGYKLLTTGSVAGTYQWDASYSGDGSNNIGASDDNDTAEVVTVSVANPAISTTPSPTSVNLPPGATLNDSATLSGGYYPTGKLTFTLYDPLNDPVDAETVTVTGNGTYSTPKGYTLPTSGTVAGSYQWDSSYSGDTNNKGISEVGATAEQVTVNAVSPSLTTTPNPTSVTFGSTTPLKDSATLSGGYYPTGNVTFYLYYNGGLSPVDTEMATVSGNGTYSTPKGYALPATGTATGTYQWDASYNGDGNNFSVSDDSAANEQVTVNPEPEQSSTSPTISEFFVTFGAETTETFKGNVTGRSGDGLPEGTVTVNYGAGPTQLCNATLGGASGYSATYSCTLSTAAQLAAGGYTGVDATYTPAAGSSSNADYNYGTSTSKPAQSFFVTKDATATKVSESPTSVTYGDESASTFTVNVKAHYGEAVPSGEQVSVRAGFTTICAVTLNAGTGTCQIPVADNSALAAGSYPVSASYGGDANLSGSSGSGAARLTVTHDATTTVVSESPTSVTYSDESASVFTVTVKAHYGEAVPVGERATVKVGFAACTVTLSGGTGTCKIANTALPAGTYPVSASYGGDPNLSGSSSSAATGLTVTRG